MRAYALVCSGAVVGASLRWAVGELVPVGGEGFPYPTLVVNVVGCVLAGLAARYLVAGSDRWLAVVTGGMGGLTTYSAFAAETRLLVDTDQAGLALVYVATSVIAGLAATTLARGDWTRP
ncbi:MAG: CrcB family protein [Ilumatobacter sp.]|uniref:fluoride efflux transporter FluC n=1 Tax=Ilumatobacter sp. TaxID=1967498 RepID=UPI0026135157|nr:CrcB family protein [Ilumatobacter sp.]MDJ0770055.1 CrcB family protein [Ilumatobacter sp.]